MIGFTVANIAHIAFYDGDLSSVPLKMPIISYHNASSSLKHD